MSTVALTEDTFEDTLTSDEASDAERAQLERLFLSLA